LVKSSPPSVITNVVAFFQIRRDLYFGDGDVDALQVGVAEMRLAHDVGQRVADLFADAQLTLRARCFVSVGAFAHG
jgi:hypothetical protein